MAELKPPGTTESYDSSWSFTLRGSGPAVLADIRGWIGDVLGDLAQDQVADVILIADELVTNAFDHGGGPYEIRISRMRTPCWVTLEVDDGGSESPVLGRSRFAAGFRGRGLILVDQLAQDWGTTTHPELGVKSVWAHVKCTEPSGAPRLR